MQTTIEQTDYIGQQAQLIAIRYLAEKHQEQLQRRINTCYYAMAGLVLIAYIGGSYAILN